ncbi:alpha/beta hydrolase family protein [Paenibacillus roseipurpureus]|uniref:Dienelactone hydrolase family protein n=1 Tax=Paenibacillus roseopurpureus TaxID=2918901 RepID=A0AA96LQP3_9BACL|nr:dienelactone hydrolase family protein [Paenibacillus sp. MBLB1832]WNR45556.1 dienelactone hydrolase family protein [Paenibacillus sp. MBLB1832]
MNLFKEEETAGNAYRLQQYQELLDFIENQRALSTLRREQYFQPDCSSEAAYVRSSTPYRHRLKAMLGWPLTEPPQPPVTDTASFVQIGEDELGSIYRANIPVMEGLTAYGLYFLPHGEGPFPLVVSQHGGQGTPELCSGFFGSENYHDMTRRVLRRGAAVFAPQLLLWNAERFGPEFQRQHLDTQFKQLGSSLAAIELFKIQGCINKLLERPELDTNRVGMIGLSYGGFYTLFTAAIDTRIQVSVSSCFVNDRFRYDWPDWTWFNAGNMLLDGEICGLVCPRPLYLEAGEDDELFHPEGFRAVSAQVMRYYEALGIADKFSSQVFKGTHELNPQEDPVDFLFKWL